MTENLTPVEVTQDEDYGEKVCPVCDQKQDLDLLPEPKKEKLRRQLQIAGVWEAIWKFVDLVGKTSQPFMTRLCFIDRKTKEPIPELPPIQLWAGVGEMTPISRLEQKNEQINTLEQYLYKEVVPKTLELQSELARASDWTSASDPPKTRRKVIVYDTSDGFNYGGWYDKRFGWLATDGSVLKKPTFWREMLKVPK